MRTMLSRIVLAAVFGGAFLWPLLLNAHAFGGPKPAVPGFLVGFVFDSVTGAPIDGVKVTVLQPFVTVQTDSAGQFFVPLPPGDYTLDFALEAEGYLPSPEIRQVVTILAGQMTGISVGGSTGVYLIPKDAGGSVAVTGTVSDSARHIPVAGVMVQLTPGFFEGISDSSGVYSITVPADYYTASVLYMLDPVSRAQLPVPSFNAPALISASGLPTVEADILVDLPQLPSVMSDIDGNGSVDATDVQTVINGALSLDIHGAHADIDADSAVNAVDVQLVVNAAIGIV